LENIKVPVKADVNDERITEGVLEIHRFNPSERMMNAIKKLVLWWLIAIFSVLIPVMHFVLVPLFFFLGIFLSYRSYKSTGRVLAGTLKCPHCQAEIQIKPNELHWPLSEICQSCARVVRISELTKN
jgi:hypothetical protein